MLPDSPEIKAELSDFVSRYSRERLRHHLGPLREIRSVSMHEGDGSILYPDVDKGRTQRCERSEASSTISIDELKGWRIDDIKTQVDKLALELSQEMGRRTYDAIQEATDQAKTSFDARGKPLTAEMILEALSAAEIEFRGDGIPVFPVLHVPPELIEGVRGQLERLGNDPALAKRFDELTELKRKEWYARQAGRELVG